MTVRKKKKTYGDVAVQEPKDWIKEFFKTGDKLTVVNDANFVALTSDRAVYVLDMDLTWLEEEQETKKRKKR